MKGIKKYRMSRRKCDAPLVTRVQRETKNDNFLKRENKKYLGCLTALLEIFSAKVLAKLSQRELK